MTTGVVVSNFRLVHEFPKRALESAWREFLTRADWASHYTAPEYFLEPFWKGKRPFAVLAMEGDEIAAILTGCHEGNSTISGVTGRPQACFDRGRDYSGAARALTRGILMEAGSAELVSVIAWDRLELGGFRVRPLEGNVVLDLTKGTATLYKHLHENRRRNIRYAKEHDVEVCEATSEEDFKAYYEVYGQWRHTTRKKIFGEEVPFEVMREAFRLRGSRRLFVARHQGKVVAGTILRFVPGGLLEYAANSSLDEYNHLRPNDLLIWRTIEWGCAEGFRQYSLGGAHPFLQKTGGIVKPLYRHRLDRSYLRWHDRRERLRDDCRSWLRRVPQIDRSLRRLLGKA